MYKNQPFFKNFLFKLHYKTVLGMIAGFLILATFSGLYFFDHSIVNEADEQQRVAKIQLQERSSDDIASDNDSESSDSKDATITKENNNEKSIGGISGTTSPTTEPTKTATPTATQTPTATPSAAPKVAVADNALILGDINATTTIVAYYDFECAFCASFVKDTLPQLKKEYFDTKKAKFIFKNFPLSTHATAPYAHTAAMCAAEQNKFWEMHDLLFENQTSWSGKSEADAKARFSSYAETLRLSGEFDTCLADDRYTSYIENHKKDGQGKGINGTPTFLIGNETIVGAQPIDAFRAVLNAQ